jgi:Flp pilus assembly protein TadG
MKRLLQTLRRFFYDTEGSALVEMTIILPVIVPLMVGGVELGRVFSDYTTADKSMREAARYLARVPEAGVCTANPWGLARAKDLAMYGSLNPGQDPQPLITDWTDPNTITLTAPACGSFGPQAVLRLSAQVPFNVTMLSAIGFPDSFTLDVRHEERHVGE